MDDHTWSTATPGVKTGDLFPVLRALAREPGPPAFIHPPCLNTRLVSSARRRTFRTRFSFFLQQTHHELLCRPFHRPASRLTLPCSSHFCAPTSDGDHPPAPRDQERAPSGPRLQAGEGTKRNQLEGIPPAALAGPGLRAPPHLPHPEPHSQGGPGDSGSRPPCSKKSSGSGGGACPNFLKGSNPPPPSPPKASNSATSRDPEGPGSLSRPGPELGGAPEGKPPSLP